MKCNAEFSLLSRRKNKDSENSLPPCVKCASPLVIELHSDVIAQHNLLQTPVGSFKSGAKPLATSSTVPTPQKFDEERKRTDEVQWKIDERFLILAFPTILSAHILKPYS